MESKKKQDEQKRKTEAIVNASMMAKAIEYLCNHHLEGEEDASDVAVAVAVLARHAQRELREAL